MPTQGQWRWCAECAALHFAGSFDAQGDTLSTGACAGSASGNHSVTGSGQYTLVFNEPRAPGQDGWQRCVHCQGLFFFGTSRDLAGCRGAPDGNHEPTAKTQYTLIHDDATAPGQTGWQRCKLCHALFYGLDGPGACAGRSEDRAGEGHVTGAGIYNVLLDSSNSEILLTNAEILAVHAALLPTDAHGAVLYFSGSDYTWADQPIETRNIDSTRIWRASAPAAIEPVSPAPFRHDLFCCGQAFLSDGRLLAAGGTASGLQPRSAGPGGHAHHWPGQANASIFDPRAVRRDGGRGAWRPATPMSRGRWYPTLVAGFGDVLVMGGHPELGAEVHSNTMVEEWREYADSWRHVGDEPTVVQDAIRDDPRPDPFVRAHPQDGGWPEQYPRLHMLPDGRVLVVRLTGRTGDRTWMLDRAGPELQWTDLCPAPRDMFPADGEPYYSSGYFYLGTTVLLPLAGPDYRTRVLYVGERQPLILDLGPLGRGASKGWTRRHVGVRDWPSRPGNRAPVRHHCNATLLPDGTVLVVGGADVGVPRRNEVVPDPVDPGFASASATVMEAELFDPVHGTWTTLARLQVPRSYHTTALLLPDGRVWIGGSTPIGAERETSIEAFSPPYLFRGPRPRNDLPYGAAVEHGSDVTIATPDAETVTRVTLLRCGSATHGFNSDQRHVELAITDRGSTHLEVRPPPLDVASFGWYMLFLINSLGVPSHGVMVHVRPPRAPERVVDDRAENTGFIIGNVADGGYIIFRPGRPPLVVGPWNPLVVDLINADLRAQMVALDKLGLRHLVSKDWVTDTVIEAAAELDKRRQASALVSAAHLQTIGADLAARGIELSVTHLENA